MAPVVHLEGMSQCSRGVPFHLKQRREHYVAKSLMCTIVHTTAEGVIKEMHLNVFTVKRNDWIEGSEAWQLKLSSILETYNIFSFMAVMNIIGLLKHCSVSLTVTAAGVSFLIQVLMHRRSYVTICSPVVLPSKGIGGAYSKLYRLDWSWFHIFLCYGSVLGET